MNKIGLLAAVVSVVLHTPLSAQALEPSWHCNERALVFNNKAEDNLHAYLSFLARNPSMFPRGLNDQDQQKWHAAIDQYRILTSQPRYHPLFSDSELSELTQHLLEPDNVITDLPVNDLTRDYFAVMSSYRDEIWPQHQAQNKAWTEHSIALLNEYGDSVCSRLNDIFGTDVIVVEQHQVSTVARPFTHAGAFTSGRNFFTFINTFQDGYKDWFALEMVFHEVAHTSFPDSPLYQALKHQAKQQGKQEAFKSLWHPMLFYIVGEVTRQSLAEQGHAFVPYISWKGVYKNRQDELAKLTRYLQPYIDGQVSQEVAIKNLIDAL
ncbi:hypothetical protein CWB99_05420 [Pseudoalteromonas rubra]|uniref:DUF4932 domain-containing protein n=1 Tax=Pseudoalteromonas rubra TaxID=43658 RepID=A0A5S3WRN8_9GAMM|nr:hypothetical protein [Pseudoalteromonas rubra]TMP30776.1 hypothetical protein CWB99_05420 [Pseudoalteromonas rubra]TMP34144.1 hypothetical protein CWC00_08250 [Pseudoalteromonas rubra]